MVLQISTKPWVCLLEFHIFSSCGIALTHCSLPSHPHRTPPTDPALKPTQFAPHPPCYTLPHVHRLHHIKKEEKIYPYSTAPAFPTINPCANALIRPKSILTNKPKKTHTAHNFAAYEATTAVPSLVASAHGVVLELGPGAGTQLGYFTASRVEHVYGVEPNTAFAPGFAARLAETSLGQDAKYTLVPCGVEDGDALARHGVVEGSLDCVVSMQVLVSYPRTYPPPSCSPRCSRSFVGMLGGIRND